MTKKVNISTDPSDHVQQVSEAIAMRLREVRKKQKLSLDELARRSGVSKGMVVEIENCNANPSIAILCKISAALGLSVADVVDVAGTPAARLIEAAEIPTLWNGPEGGTARLLAGTSGPNMIELWKWEIKPGEFFESSGHPAGTFELFHVEQGTLRLEIGETALIIQKDCSAIAKTDAPHQYINGGKDDLIFTMTVAELHQ
ncbi:XRE family transcriptional regulator [Pseudomonas ceruminis]|uniref:helix-turn-helix domain-containing protein n=1 Tax=Pseudomonas TaxID=286 RepID=UPI001295D18F|nr:helix-turn-helix domain-containing protein [Pseudomonas sp. FSL R10-0399]MQT59818.1 helix-turn-helix domain-containing protein [Pseudomonas sp. FSL R10-0399]